MTNTEEESNNSCATRWMTARAKTPMDFTAEFKQCIWTPLLALLFNIKIPFNHWDIHNIAILIAKATDLQKYL